MGEWDVHLCAVRATPEEYDALCTCASLGGKAECHDRSYVELGGELGGEGERRAPERGEASAGDGELPDEELRRAGEEEGVDDGVGDGEAVLGGLAKGVDGREGNRVLDGEAAGGAAAQWPVDNGLVVAAPAVGGTGEGALRGAAGDGPVRRGVVAGLVAGGPEVADDAEVKGEVKEDGWVSHGEGGGVQICLPIFDHWCNYLSTTNFSGEDKGEKEEEVMQEQGHVFGIRNKRGDQ